MENPSQNFSDEEENKNRTLYLANKDLNAILLELIKEDIQISKITIATELAAEQNQKKEEKTDKDVFSEEKVAQFP